MSEPMPLYGGPAVLDRERQRLVVTLRQLADCLDALPADELADAMLRLPGPADALFREARLVLKRPFGE